MLLGYAHCFHSLLGGPKFRSAQENRDHKGSLQETHWHSRTSSGKFADTILELTGKIQELQNEVNCMNDSRDFQDAESARSGHSHVTSQPVSFPPHPVPGGMLSRSIGMPSCKDCPPSIWDTHGISGNVFASPTASSSAPFPQESNPWISNCADFFPSLFLMMIFRNSIRNGTEFFVSMTKIPSDDILEGLYKLRIRGSEKLKTVLELYNMEIHQKKAGPYYHRLKTRVKRSIEQEFTN